MENERKRPVDGSDDVDSKKAKTNIETTNNNSDPNLVGKEELVGIIHFIGKKEDGFTGVLKQRYSDFIVNEVDLSGTVVHLKDLQSLPLEDTQEASQPVTTSIINQKDSLVALIGDDQAEAVMQYLTKEANNVNETLKLKPIDNKEQRTKVHQVIKTNFPTLISGTYEGGGIELSFKSNTNSKQSKREGRFNAKNQDSWPKAGGKNFLRFVMFKENKDTIEALGIIARFLKVKTSLFTFAGTKDKRGVTCQHVTAHRVAASRLRDLNPKIFGIKMGDFTYVNEQLSLGQLKGNEFTIVIRDVKADEERITRSINTIKEHGFINYYGLQRFGTGSIGTYEVGIALLQGKYEEAIDLILKPRVGESLDCSMARTHFYNSGKTDFTGTLKILPKIMFIESIILNTLSKVGSKAYLNAFQSLPRNSRLLYAHSYQSYVWNHMTSQRISIYGADKVVPGDLVLLSSTTNTSSGTNSATESDKSEVETETPTTEEDVAEDAIDARAEVHIVTEEDVASNRFSIYDVVLPLPGFAVQYPTNDIGTKYKEFMSAHGLDPNNMKRNVRELSMGGSYRKIMGKVENMEWNIVHYSDYKVALTVTDLERIQNKEASVTANNEGPLKAIVLKFTLGTSSYATMLFRELLKQTSEVPRSAFSNPSLTKE